MLRLSLLCALLVGGCATVHFEPRADDGFLERVDGGRRYYVYRPAAWTPAKKWPVIVYLHGGFERGTDGVKPTQAGLGPWVWRTHGQFPYVVLFPQSPPNGFWANKSEEAHVLEVLQRSMREDSVDTDRVYLTGNSMGGFGTWVIGAQHPELFAALMPICGGAAPPKGRKLPPDAPFANEPDPELAAARAIGKMAVWAFHGARDWIVDPKQTIHVVEKLHSLGNDAKMTIYPDLGHNSWDRTYSNPALWEWLATQKRSH